MWLTVHNKNKKTFAFSVNVKRVDRAVPLNYPRHSNVLLKFHWAQLELQDHRLELTSPFN